MTFGLWSGKNHTMNEASGQSLPRTGVWNFLATVWPVASPTDSEIQRRQKVAVRGGQLAMVAMVGTAVVGTALTNFEAFSGRQLLALAIASLVYISWSLHGMRDAVRSMLGQPGAPTNIAGSGQAPAGAVPYFALQLGLAGLVYYLGDQGQVAPLLWLVLLPPVAHSVILLRGLGIAVVSVLSMALLVFNQLYWHGWPWVLNAGLAFCSAVLFTLVFTLLAVSSEKARGEVQRLAGELGEANRKLREYAVQAEELAATRERNRLAREIHDSLGHYLTVANVQLEAARALRDREPVRAHDALVKAQSLIQEGLQEIRRSVATLRASPLDNQSLAEALRQIVEESRTSGLAADMTVQGTVRPLAPPAELTLYRAAQEGLTNVRKHARTNGAQLVLDYQAPARVRLSISDDGAGAASDDAVRASGFGLLGLRERAQLLGGEVHVRTAPGAGFTLEVEVPG